MFYSWAACVIPLLHTVFLFIVGINGSGIVDTVLCGLTVVPPIVVP